MKAAEAPFEAAQTALVEIEENARIRAAFERLILPNAAIFLGSDYVADDQKVEFRQLAKLKGADPSANYRGLLILVCSTFEFFAKQLIRNVVFQRTKSAVKYDDLPRQFVLSAFSHSGQFFQKERDSFQTAPGRQVFEDLAKGLATLEPGSTGFSISPGIFVEYLGNCTSHQVEQRFRDLGLESPFEGNTLGGFNELKSFFGGGGVRQVATQSRDRLDQLIKRRNSIVHSATISETVTIDDIVESSAFVRALMGGIREIVSKS